VQRVAVALGTRTATDVEVVDGLTAGQRIVVAGHQKLFPGAKVMPVESTAPANPGPGGAAQGGPGGAASPGGNGADAKGGDGK
jgi:membrane fusion protein (multidrug efflux system)